MLEFKFVSQHAEKQSLLNQLDLNSASWIVSDLKSKFEVQSLLLARTQCLPQESVLRVNEFWQNLLKRIDPSLRFVSLAMVRAYAEKFCDENHKEEVILESPQAADALIQYCETLLPILCHGRSDELLGEWFRQNPEAFMRWGTWYIYARRFWLELQSRKVLPAAWSAAYLSQNTPLEWFWERKVYFDLGSDLTRAEAEIILKFSQQIDVTVLAPSEAWLQNFKALFSPYELLQPSLFSKKNIPALDSLPIEKMEFRKFSTMLAEVKEAVAQTRKWLEQGVSAHKIAVLAPQIEKYWPSLSRYFHIEGVLVNKDKVVNAQTFSDAGNWLAHLRLYQTSATSEDLERVFFESPRAAMTYSDFQHNYAKIYNRQDLVRHPKGLELLSKPIPREKILLRDEFMGWALQMLPKDLPTSEGVRRITDRFFQDSDQSTELSLTQWITYLENLASHIEIRTDLATPQGVQVLNLTSADWVPSTHIFVMGLAESELRKKSSTALKVQDLAAIEKDLGFTLREADSEQMNFELSWLLMHVAREKMILSSPATDFSGTIIAPSTLWLSEAYAVDKEKSSQIATPLSTRWDEIQASSLEQQAELRNWSAERALLLQKSIQTDLGLLEPEHFGEKQISSLSASGLSSYQKCPFVFASERLLNLRDVSLIDIDMDGRSRGSLLHALLEFFTTEPMRFDWSDIELEKKIDQIAIEKKISVADPEFWPTLRSYYLQLTKRFFEFEKAWREKFPATQTVARELSVEGFWDRGKKEFSKEESIPKMQIKGSIDRVDQDSTGNSVVIDYKSSATELNQYTSWLQKDQWQLLLYIEALEKGLTALGAREVVGAFYFVTKTMDRTKGLRVDDHEQELFSLEDSVRNKVSSEVKNQLMMNWREKVGETVDKIISGAFPPQPKEKKLCENCHWRVACRAPHLN